MENNNAIVIYQSKTGFTEQYARWIARALHCDIQCLEQFNRAEMPRYDVVIFGAGIHAGKIRGARFIKNTLAGLSGKEVVVFATGATAPIPEEIARFQANSIPQGANIRFFYFQSGMNYARIHGLDRLMMAALKAILSMKKNKSDVEQGTLTAIQTSYDYSNQCQTEPLITYVRTITSK